MCFKAFKWLSGILCFFCSGDRVSVAQGSDASSVNGDEVDRGSLAQLGSAPQPHSDLLSPTDSCSSLGGVPRCLSPAPSDPFPSGSSLLSNGSHISGSVSSLDSDASGSTVTSTDSHPTNQRGGHSYSHHDTTRSRRLEAEARKAEKRSRFRSPDRREREAILSPERRWMSASSVSCSCSLDQPLIQWVRCEKQRTEKPRLQHTQKQWDFILRSGCLFFTLYLFTANSLLQCQCFKILKWNPEVEFLSEAEI